MPKAASADQATKLTDIPNVGLSIAADLRGLGIATPDDVRRMNPLAAYEALCASTAQRHDPCVLDVFMAAHDFMNGGRAQPWWAFTPQRKALLAQTRRGDA
ncbi:mitomycin resistance protein [Allofranklinella schreckenbergeri]|uniref:Mitomycin resistance protein n=1 Tax=Allofranklinella schreckenbergeri TaxID=1076744 RepID=A0A3M6QX61_9BURK|nr:helix-hairpin-helix domain-containing protein [Allofranklinella schreckenbergeri]RMX07169.1 mitomycin resistance protein [Allofranklinella schreckenbergeri]